MVWSRRWRAHVRLLSPHLWPAGNGRVRSRSIDEGDPVVEAGLTDAKVHDLRHTFASIIVSGDGSLPVIGVLLGMPCSMTSCLRNSSNAASNATSPIAPSLLLRTIASATRPSGSGTRWRGSCLPCCEKLSSRDGLVLLGLNQGTPRAAMRRRGSGRRIWRRGMASTLATTAGVAMISTPAVVGLADR